MILFKILRLLYRDHYGYKITGITNKDLIQAIKNFSPNIKYL